MIVNLVLMRDDRRRDTIYAAASGMTAAGMVRRRADASRLGVRKEVLA